MTKNDRRTIEKMIKNKKLLLMIVLSVLYIGLIFPTATTEASLQKTTEGIVVEEADEPNDDETTIEDEPVAEAARMEQNQAIYTTQIVIITIGIVMVCVGTYVFILKKDHSQ